jgi:peptidoglycan hydrolase-like protein with peptidoglycan-binding domain
MASFQGPGLALDSGGSPPPVTPSAFTPPSCGPSSRWRRAAAASSPIAARSSSSSGTTYLVYLDYNPGPVDGVVGRFTRSALRMYQEREGLPVRKAFDADMVRAVRGRAVAGT